MAIKALTELKPQTHQEECLLALENARAQGANKALVIMASGLGKTVTAIFDAKGFIEEHGGRVLCLCHRNDILDQLKVEFKDAMKILGSEYSFGMYNGSEKTNKVNGEKVNFLFASFQTMVKAIFLGKFAMDEFTYIIVDEAHHAAAVTFFGVLKYFTPLFLLGMTATPDRKDKADLNVIFGETVYDVRFPKAIAAGLLTKPKVRLLMDEVVKLGKIYCEERGRRIPAGELNRRMFAKIRDDRIAELIWEEIAMAGVEKPRMVIFCRGIRHAEEIAKRIPGSVLFHSRVGTIESVDARSKKNLQAFRDGETDTIVVIDRLNEGIDVPDINVVVNLRQAGSRIVAEQQLGRGLRRHPSKEFVLVLDFVQNIQRLMMYWKMDKDIKDAKKVDPNNLRSTGGGGGGGGDVTGLDITTNNPDFEREDLDLMGVVEEVVAMVGDYTKEGLIAQLVRWSNEHGGVTPTTIELNRDPTMACSATFCKFFGSYSSACWAAGLIPNYEFVTDDELISQIQKKAKELGGRSPTSTEVDCDETMANSGVYRKHFGSFSKALELAGLTPYGYTKELLIAQLQKKAKELKRRPTAFDVSSDKTMASTTTYREHFGCLNSALIAAGFEPYAAEGPRISNEELIVQLKSKAVALGHVPTGTEINDDKSMASTRTIIDRFGSLANALREAGLKPGREYLTDSQLIALMKAMAERLGRNPKRRELDADNDMPSASVYTKRFGSYSGALAAAGLLTE